MEGKRELQADAIYSREEAAELLGVSLSTIKRLISAGQLEASRPDSIKAASSSCTRLRHWAS